MKTRTTNYLEVRVETNSLCSEMIGEILSSHGCSEFILAEQMFSGKIVSGDIIRYNQIILEKKIALCFK